MMKIKKRFFSKTHHEDERRTLSTPKKQEDLKTVPRFMASLTRSSKTHNRGLLSSEELTTLDSNSSILSIENVAKGRGLTAQKTPWWTASVDANNAFNSDLFTNSKS